MNSLVTMKNINFMFFMVTKLSANIESSCFAMLKGPYFVKLDTLTNPMTIWVNIRCDR